MKLIDTVFDASIDYFMERPLLWIAVSLYGFVMLLLSAVGVAWGVWKVVVWAGF